jgi:hypothetical protein
MTSSNSKGGGGMVKTVVLLIDRYDNRELKLELELSFARGRKGRVAR